MSMRSVTAQRRVRPIPSVWGHIAGGPGLNPADVKFIDEALRELLAN